MISKKNIAFPIALALCAASMATWANDTSVGSVNGSIVFKKQAHISMDKEVLTISSEKVDVDYIFTNTSKSDLIVSIAFPMPPMDYGPDDHNETHDFKLWINGQAIKTKRKLVVLLDGKIDISAAVEKLGLSEKDLISLLDFDTKYKTKARKRLPKEWLDEEGNAGFTLTEYFLWDQSFPAEKSVSIKHSYVPGVTSGVPLALDSLLEQYGKDTCLDKDMQASLKKRQKPYGLSYQHVRYILTTGNNWQGPIKDFTLRIKKQDTSDLMSLCLDGDLKKIDPLTFEFKQTNFRPKRDLSILFSVKSE